MFRCFFVPLDFVAEATETGEQKNKRNAIPAATVAQLVFTIDRLMAPDGVGLLDTAIMI